MGWSGTEASFASAETIAQQYPQYASQITAAAKASFLAGDQYAYIAGILAILLSGALVYFKFPKLDEEKRLLAAYHAEDTKGTAAEARTSTDEALQPIS